ncbi:tetratricopeptide repeat protein [Sphingosinicella sp.]|uniref:tetratricopeptide repeat protein n=1 Tax=Sphingosinicella sp. TaxID=1917971 RepID=UPI004038411D
MGIGIWRLALVATAVAAVTPALAQQTGVRAGVDAWQQGNYEEAVRQWRPLADRGDADAQYNLAQAYKLGRGVPLNMTLAEQWYERAARQGHEQAGANLGLILFQNGRRREAMPYIERAAGGGDPRAQYVLGTALFNGDVVARDWPRAWAMMSRAAADGLPPAVQQLQAMEQHLSPEDRARGDQLAAEMARGPRTRVADAEPAVTGATGRPRERARPPRIAQAEPPPAPRPQPPRVRPEPQRPAPPQARPAPPRPAPVAQAGGRWRIQLGAFSSEAAARSAWAAVAGRLPGMRPTITRAGAMFRLQAGGLANREAATRACAAARTACFPVAP